MLPFTREQFLVVFVAYNEALWPAQMLAYVLWLPSLAVLGKGDSRALSSLRSLTVRTPSSVQPKPLSQSMRSLANAWVRTV